MTSTPTPSPVAGPSDGRDRPALYAIGDRVFIEEDDDRLMSGPYWVTWVVRQGREIPFYYYELKEEPGRKDAVKHSVPEWYLSSGVNYGPGGEEDASYDMREAGKRSEKMRERKLVKKKRRSSQGTKPRLETWTEVEESAVGSSKQEQGPKTETKEKEPVVGSSRQEQLPKAEADDKKPAMGSKEPDEKK